jgi:hypothetical protein
METARECREKLKPFLEALGGVKETGFQGIARIQTIEWPLTQGERRGTVEIILELRKDVLLS